MHHHRRLNSFVFLLFNEWSCGYIHIFSYFFFSFRSATCNQTDWAESGYGVYYSYKDLAAQGMLSSDKLQPWKRVQESVVWTARRFKQIYIIVWYPYQFGAVDPKAPYAQRHRFQNIIQTIIPTRTGLDGLKSTAAVWLTARNETAPTTPPRMYRATDREVEEQQQDQVVSPEGF